jgi:hypothetical protein
VVLTAAFVGAVTGGDHPLRGDQRTEQALAHSVPSERTIFGIDSAATNG